MAGNQLLEDLKKKYGNKVGTRIYLTIVPGILADFKKVLNKAEPDTEVTETYNFEEGDGAVEVTGSRKESGEIKVKAHLISIDK